MAINFDEHTITQSALALEQPPAWKSLESFAEYGGWHEGRVTYALTRLIAGAPGRIWHDYHVSAVDDTNMTVHSVAILQRQVRRLAAWQAVCGPEHVVEHRIGEPDMAGCIYGPCSWPQIAFFGTLYQVDVL
jgi:hypothetical protein